MESLKPKNKEKKKSFWDKIKQKYKPKIEKNKPVVKWSEDWKYWIY